MSVPSARARPSHSRGEEHEVTAAEVDEVAAVEEDESMFSGRDFVARPQAYHKGWSGSGLTEASEGHDAKCSVLIQQLHKGEAG